MTDQPLSTSDTAEVAYQKGFTDGRLQGFHEGLEAAQATLNQLLVQHRQDLLRTALAGIDNDTPIETLGLRVQISNALKREGIHTVNRLLGTSLEEIRRIRGPGPRWVSEIVEKLASMQLSLPESITDRIHR